MIMSKGNIQLIKFILWFIFLGSGFSKWNRFIFPVKYPQYIFSYDLQLSVDI